MAATLALANNANKVRNYFTQFDELNIVGIDCSRMSVVDCILQCRTFKAKQRGTNMNSLSTAAYALRRFEETMCAGHKIMPYHITDQLWMMAVDYWLNDCALNPNYIIKTCQTICTCLDWASKHGARLSSTYRDYHVDKEDVVRVILTASEIARIYYFDFKQYQKTHPRTIRNIKQWERIRDMFVLQCNLGQRASDMFRIQPEMFDHSSLRLKQQKTKNDCVIDLRTMPIDPKITREILSRYNYTPPYKGTISTYNRKIHKLCEIVGINAPVTYEAVKDGKVTMMSKPKYELISSHTARRSFISYNYLYRDKTSQVVRRASGHKSDTAFQLYAVYQEDYES